MTRRDEQMGSEGSIAEGAACTQLQWEKPACLHRSHAVPGQPALARRTSVLVCAAGL